MITSKQRAYLRGQANGMSAIFQVGKNGINDNLVKQLDDALEARELIKVSVLETSPDDVKSVCHELAAALNAETVQVVGFKFVLYRQAKEDPQIELPK